MSFPDFIALLRCGKENPGLYVYDWLEHSALKPGAGQVSWPAEFVLTQFHRKHLFNWNRRPKMSDIGRGLATWEHKVRWQMALKDHEDCSPWWKLQTKPKCVWTCEEKIHHRLEALISGVKEKVFAACRYARSRHSRHIFQTPPISGAVRLGLNLLRKGPWAAIPTDKDGGFALMPKAELENEEKKMLSTSAYRAEPNHSEKAEEIIQEYMDAAKVIGVRRPDLGRALLSDLRRQGIEKVFSIVKCTIKTHKEDGEVVPRVLHTSCSHPMKPGTRYVASILKPVLAGLPHVLRDSTDLLRSLACVVVPDEARLVKFDIKDFFMSGEHDELLDTCCNEVSQDEEDDFRSVLKSILGSQYVSVRGCNDTVWKVVRGSGMGVVCSGEVSDVCFYALAEKHFCLDPHVRKKFDIMYYGRFKDDGLLIIGGNVESRVKFFNFFKTRAKFFDVKVESISRCSCTMLDVRLYKGERWRQSGILDSELYEKQTSQWVPLSDTSQHPDSVHKSWPKMMLRRCVHRCSSKSKAKAAQNRFHAAMAKRFGLHKYMLDPPVYKQSKPKNFSKHSRIIFPFHKDWQAAGVSKILRDESRRMSSCELLRTILPFDQISVSWRLGGRHLVQILGGYNLVAHKDAHLYSLL